MSNNFNEELGTFILASIFTCVKVAIKKVVAKGTLHSAPSRK